MRSPGAELSPLCLFPGTVTGWPGCCLPPPPPLHVPRTTDSFRSCLFCLYCGLPTGRMGWRVRSSAPVRPRGAMHKTHPAPFLLGSSRVGERTCGDERGSLEE